jgi:glyceraldehyde-3-phosphate dehydrogenase (NAD(P))
MMKTIRVAINGYGVIGRRVADAVALQEDMEIAGVADIASDYRIKMAESRGFPLYAATADKLNEMRQARLDVRGTLDDLLKETEVIVDCTPKGVDAKNKARYEQANVKAIFQGGAKHELTGHSFVASANYESALGRSSTRVVSCNTTATVRTLNSLRAAGLLERARGVLIRRATDPWESHQNGIINTMVLEKKIPSHQAPDAKTVVPELDVVTMAVSAPENVGHLHYWTVELTRAAAGEEVLEAFSRNSRIAFIRASAGLTALNVTADLMLEIGRPRGAMWEVAVWEDILTVKGKEAFYAYQVDNQAIVIPENVDAIRALAGREPSAPASIERTNQTLGVRQRFV